LQRAQDKDYLVLLQQGVAEQTEATSKGLRDELRELRDQLRGMAHENIDLREQLQEFEDHEDDKDDTADNTMDTEARLRILSDEVRTLRGTLSDLSHENADLREQLLDLEDTEKAADEAVERSTDAPPADYYRDPYEQADAEERQIVMVQAAADAERLAALALPLEEEVQPACGGDDHSGRDPDCAVVNGTPSSAVPVDGPRGGDERLSRGTPKEKDEEALPSSSRRQRTRKPFTSPLPHPNVMAGGPFCIDVQMIEVQAQVEPLFSLGVLEVASPCGWRLAPRKTAPPGSRSRVLAASLSVVLAASSLLGFVCSGPGTF
jgi:hypothetical protein